MLVGLVLLPAVAIAADAVRVGFVGLRHGHAWRQLADISTIDEAEFVGVAESIEGLVEEAKKVQPNAHYASDYRQFVKDQKPQIVWAFVENNRHLEIVEFLAPLGVHVIFEKPLASIYADAVQIQNLATKHGIKVMTNYQMAWWPTNHAQKRAVAAGEIGDVWRLHGVVGNGGPAPRDLRRRVFFDWLTDPDANGAGAMVDFGIYSATWAAWHLGLPTAVYGSAQQLQPERFPKVDDNAVIVLTYPQGMGVFEASWNLPRGYQQLEVIGSKGSIAMNRAEATLQASRKQPAPMDVGELDATNSHPVRYMIDRVRRDAPLEHIVALDLNVNAMHILDAAVRSAKTGEVVKLPLAGPSNSD